jgi:hypothetical protein
MTDLLMYQDQGNVVAIFILVGLAILLSVLALVAEWGIDIHKHLEAEGIAYDELHPEERAEQERRAAGPPRP